MAGSEMLRGFEEILPCILRAISVFRVKQWHTLACASRENTEFTTEVLGAGREITEGLRHHCISQHSICMV